MKTLFVDQLNFYSAFNILYKYSLYDEIRLISDPTFSSKLWKPLLTLFGVKIYQENFFFGDIFNSKGESIYIDSQRIASEESLEYSAWLIKEAHFSKFGKLDSYGKKVLKLFISKTVWDEMVYFTRRIMYVKYTYPDSTNYFIAIKTPRLISTEYLENSFQKFNLIFYGTNRILILKKYIFSLVKKGLRFKYLFLKNKNKNNKKSIVTIAVDTISLNTKERAFPNFFEKKDDRDFYVLNLNNFKVNISKKNLKNNNIIILNCKNHFFYATNKRKLNLSNSHRIPQILKLDIKMFLNMANGIDNLLRELNCEKFIFSDPQYNLTDAVQINSKETSVETICIQYSNIGMKGPLMMTMADRYLTFSNLYNKVFTWKDIRPNKFDPIGYSVKTDDNSLYKIKSNLSKKGVKKIIVYFDESVQKDKWGLISEQQYLNHLNILAKTVINNYHISIILKPQFVYNSIKRFQSKIIGRAIETGRFIELNKGQHRNSYKPSNVSQIADYCIGDLVGATAALEFAISNKKALLINPHGYISEFQSIYNKCNIVFPSLKNAIDSILKNEKDAGDWSKIIDNFIDFNNEKKIKKSQKKLAQH